MNASDYTIDAAAKIVSSKETRGTVVRILSLGIVLSAALLSTGCGGVSETLGLAKNSPDESVVPTSRPLAVPPDYALNPPQAPGTVNNDNIPNPPLPAASAPTTVPSQPVASNAQTITPSVAQTPASTAPAAKPDPNTIAGISKTNPDGTPKSDKQIRDELRKKRLEKKRAENPSYGTWQNLFNW